MADRCDIIMPVWNQLESTSECVESIAKNTDYPFRLIIIDNASSLETRRYLERIEDIAISLIRNETNLGFIKAVNQGISKSDADYICLLNNDTIPTGGWLKEMVAVASLEKGIGIVNPSSNNLGQRPERGEPIELFLDRLKRESVERFAELGSAVGFCMLVKREVIEKVGNLDEIYGMGNFEDTDFSRRAVKEGYKCVRACRAYVYHRESSSFGRVKTFRGDFERNREIYEFRWGKPKRIAYILDNHDDNALKKMRLESLRLARQGNWVLCISKGDVDMPRHSNIRLARLRERWFDLASISMIIKKKKKFDEIFVGNGRLANILKKISFIHKARVDYY